MSVPEAAFYREEKCAVKGQMEFWPFITAAGTGMRQLPRCDVKMQGCFVMGTHVSHKGNLVPTLPASTAFQICCLVIGRNKVCPAPSGSPPGPGQGSLEGAIKQAERDHGQCGSSRSIRPGTSTDQGKGNTATANRGDSDSGSEWLQIPGQTSQVGEQRREFSENEKSTL